MKLLFLTIFLFIFFGCNKKDESSKKEKNNPDISTKTQPVSKIKKKIIKKTTPVNKENKIHLAAIPVCDKYVKSVCACSKKHPESYEMKRACKSAKDTYPQWKRDSSKSKEEQEIIIKACQKGLLFIKASPNQCEEK